MPSASGVRIAGDDYQWLHAWRMCMEVLHEDITRNTTNPAIAVGVEEAGVGNGDDVVLYRLRPPNAYMQVKYAVDNRTAVNIAYLDEQGILRKMVATHGELTADGTPVEMRLVTNRTIDPNDVLLRDRDGRDGRLLPRAAQGGAQSDRGKARSDWAAKAGTNEDALMAFLEQFHLDVSYDLDRLRKDVSLLMTANGLRSDGVAVKLGADWISQQVIAGHRRLSSKDIKEVVAALNLQAGSPWTTVSVATIRRDQVAHEAAVAVDWVDRIGGETDWTRVAPNPPATWADLAADVRAIPSQLGGNKRILVSGHMRQATGFLIGSELRRVLGYEVGIHQGDQLWTSEERTNHYALTVTETALQAGSDTALIVNVAADAAKDAIEWIRKTGIPVDKIVTATPETGAEPKSVPTPSAANSLAVAIRQLARRYPRTGHLHLFLIGPLGLAVLLGHHWNRVTTTQVYEHLGGAEYVHAFTVDA
ncbi:hypothetical protein LX83_006969 [Goodfellowiella coeruleoviolacea]|uniref:SMODS-associated and fused to various effectors domain-containing protein n=2 Tax=Goodfellowiella coeruleoviolacea TaxID=334858 RepID=A0AAE3GKX1_9PSEU|nr:hypothetical protein [Goodfellowiella coeruleoviolacea]